MKKISFQQKNNLIVRYKNGEYFAKDLELFKKHFPGHSLNSELARASKFTFARLDGLMLAVLLEVVDIDEILQNRIAEKQPEPEPRTETEIKKLLVDNFDLDEKDLAALSGIIPLLLDKTDEEVISAVKRLMGEEINPNLENEGDDSDNGLEENADKTNQENPVQEIQRDNVKIFQQRIADAKNIEEIEAILKEDIEGGERVTVQKAGHARIEILKAASEETEGKKKD